jgi:predicted RNase H-like HicB family nuclease
MNRYTYRVEWAPETYEYVGRCIEFPSLSQRAPTAEKAITSIGHAVDEHVAERRAAEFDIPEPLTERRYSGRFVVRTSPKLHARLAVEAAEQNVSLNHWVVQKLADRPPPSLLDW